MFARNFQIRLPRRITAYFLLFGLAALVWLAVGAVYVASLVTDGRSESASLRSLGRGSDRITLAYLRNKSVDLQPLLAEVRVTERSGLLRGRVADGRIRWRIPTSSRRANPPSEVGTVTERWGEVQRVEYMNNSGVTIHEYRCPLKSGDQAFGTLRIGIARRDLWSYLRASAEFAPLAFFGPACCMVAGAVLLNRMVRPVADIEQQLHQVATSPSLESCEWREVPNVGAAAIGWNRVVQEKLAADHGSLQLANSAVARTGQTRAFGCGAQQHPGWRCDDRCDR